jgi:hypothetical protein
METFKAAAERAAKAWVAAILPILVALIAGITGVADIDLKAWAGIIGLATTQWVGVYFKTNRPA